jgi:hypothetical protein
MSRVIGGREHSQHPSSSLRIVNELVRGPSVVRLLVNRSLAFKVDVDPPRQTATQRKRPVETIADRNRSVCGFPSISGNGNMLHCIFYGSVWAQRGGLVCIQEGLWLYRFRLVQADIPRRERQRSSGCGVRQKRSILSSSWSCRIF